MNRDARSGLTYHFQTSHHRVDRFSVSNEHFKRHVVCEFNGLVNGFQDVLEVIAIVVFHNIATSLKMRRPICGFSAALVTRSTFAPNQSLKTSSSSRNSKNPTGRLNDTNTSMSLWTDASPRMHEPKMPISVTPYRIASSPRLSRKIALISSMLGGFIFSGHFRCIVFPD